MSVKEDRHARCVRLAWTRYLAPAPRYAFGKRESFIAAFRDEWRKSA